MQSFIPDTARIPQLAPLAFDQLIIAGGDDDVSAREIFDWVAPLLAGIPGGRWMSCQLEIEPDGAVMAHYRAGGSEVVLSMALASDAPVTRELLMEMPKAESMTMILLSDYASQAVTLLDGIARWLSIHDTDEPRLGPVVRLLGGFQTMLGHPA